MVHSIPDEPAGQTLGERAEDVGWHDSDGDGLAAVLDDGPDVLVAEADHVDPVDLDDVVVSEKTVVGGGAVDREGGNLAVSHHEPETTSVIKYNCLLSYRS